ncbi:MAG: porin family protein [candidate division Zixibacteria bacterium]|nr:porin family protein [candidate division Zixibacteria bacterium]
MRPIVTALLTLLLLSLSVQAENRVPGITGMGVKLGSAWATMSTNDEVFKTGSSGGFTAGAFLTYSISPKLVVQPELLYVAKGSANSNILNSSGFNCGYLEVPVLLKYNPSDKGRLKPGFFLGPAISTLLSAELYSDGFGSNYSYDVKNGMKSLDISVIVGGEIEFRSSKSVKFIVDVRYSLGLINAVDPTKWNEGRKVVGKGDWGPIHWTDYDRPLLEDNTYAKNRVFSIMIGVKFK